MIFAVIVLTIIVFILLAFIIELKKPEKEITTNIELPYQKKLLLTKNEWVFYKKLKPICDEMGLHIISKVRLADLVEVKKEKAGKEYIKYFNQINKKHIDFVLCKPENLQIVALIELDDKSHNKQNRIQRDEFVNNLCDQVKYKLIRITNNDDIHKIKDLVNEPQQPKNSIV